MSCFEGCEKKMTVVFGDAATRAVSEVSREEKWVGIGRRTQTAAPRPKPGIEGGDGRKGLRRLPREAIEEVLTLARCSVLSTVRNDYVDAYLLSESSCFVFEYKIILKTCGTTRLLDAVPKILELAAGLGLEPRYAEYSRSEFMFPENQPPPHRSFKEEVAVLRCNFPGPGFTTWTLTDKSRDGDNTAQDFCHPLAAALAGRLTRGAAPQGADGPWYVFAWGSRPSSDPAVLELAMFDLDQAAMRPFYQKPVWIGTSSGDPERAKIATKLSGLRDIIPSRALIDEHLFEPCGYSLNAIYGKYYWAVHITPEPEGSFVSYETNFETNFEDAQEDVVSSLMERFQPSTTKACLFRSDTRNETSRGWDRRGNASVHVEYEAT